MFTSDKIFKKILKLIHSNSVQFLVDYLIEF